MHRLTVTLTLALTAQSAFALGPLKDVATVRDGIIAVGMAYEIGDKCGSIEARYLRGLGFLNQIKADAAQLGYSDAEIDAYIGDDAENVALDVAQIKPLIRPTCFHHHAPRVQHHIIVVAGRREFVGAGFLQLQMNIGRQQGLKRGARIQLLQNLGRGIARRTEPFEFEKVAPIADRNPEPAFDQAQMFIELSA